MTGYLVLLKKEDVKAGVDWDWILNHQDQRVPFSFEESSIDMGLSCEPRYVVDNKVYEPYRQYFNKPASGGIERILVCRPAQTG